MRPLSQRLAAVVLLCAVVSASLQVAVHVLQCDEYVLRHLVIDDAIYFVKPARNFVLGNGFSFDGLHRTSGVQPLWAMVVTVLASAIGDDLRLLRAAVGLSGMCWIAGGVLLARALRSCGPWPATVAAIGWLLAGFESRLCMLGMENGLQGGLLGLGLWLAVRCHDAPSGRRTRQLGWCLAALALNRIEYALLPGMLAAWSLWQKRATSRRERWSSLAPLLLPTVVILGSWSVCSRVYFGDWLPISGTVKGWLATMVPSPHGEGLLAVRFVLLQSLELAHRPLVHSTWALPGVGAVATLEATVWCVVAALALPALVAFCGWLVECQRRRAIAVASPLWPWLWFAALHAVLLAAFLAPFTGYCSWYYTGEILGAWALTGLALGRLRRWAWLAAAPLLLLLAVAVAQRAAVNLQAPRYRNSNPDEGIGAGRFLERWLPSGQRIGSFNSGFIGQQARSHTVVNLDGLMNDGEYFRDYLSAQRTDQYFHDRGLRFLADCQVRDVWGQTLRGEGIKLPKGLRPFWFGLDSLEKANGVLAVPDTKGRLPEIAPHPLAAVLFDAFALGEGRIVLAAARPQVGADEQIVATVVSMADPQPLHVVLPRQQARLAVDARGVAHLPRLDVPFGGRVQLRAVEVPAYPLEPGATMALATYWSPLPQLQSGGELEFELEVAGAMVRELPAHGTLPLGVWVDGQLLAHVFVVTLPKAAADGRHRVRLCVRERGQDGALGEASVGEIRVARW